MLQSVRIAILSCLLAAGTMPFANGNEPAPVGPAAAPAASSATQPATTTAPASDPQPASDLDYWLNRAKSVELNKPVEPNKPGATIKPLGGKLAVEPANGKAGAAPAGTSGGGATAPGTAASPFRSPDLPFRRGDALPGVIELSDGNQLAGGLYTTVEKPWIVWSEATKSWRRVDFLTLLSIEAVVEEQRMELSWRPKGMGEPEKVYTGKKYPMRRMHWRFKIIDGSVVEGSTKGQPVFVELAGKVSGPFILGERMKGQDGQTLEDLVYVRKIVVSRGMMDLVIAEKAGGGR